MQQTKSISLSAANKARIVLYWIATGIVALETAVGSAWDLMRIPFVVSVFNDLGYPLYFLTFMGLWKAPGAIVMLAPGWPRLKEWVYAGLVFTYTGAAFSHAAVGDGRGAAGPVIFTLLTLLSWALRPASRRYLLQHPS